MEESYERLSIVIAQQAQQISKLEEENKVLKERLSKYTNPKSSKTYYEKNREVLKEKQRIRSQNLRNAKKDNNDNSIETTERNIVDYLKAN